MVTQQGQGQSISLQGQVIEVVENQGRLWMKIALARQGVIDLVLPTAWSVGLGDRVRVDAHIQVDRVKPDDGVELSDEHAASRARLGDGAPDLGRD